MPSQASSAAFLMTIAAPQLLMLFGWWRSEPSQRARGLALHGLIVGGFALLSLALVGTVIDGESFPPVAAFFAASNLGALALAFTPRALVLARALPAAAWLLLQGFRLPLEIILHEWHEQGAMPVQMTWSGQNFDIVSAIVALVAALVVWRLPEGVLRRRVAIAAHILGLALLLNVMRIAITSIPSSPLRAFEETLTLPFVAPYVLIVPLAVSTALFAHVVALRALRQKS